MTELVPRSMRKLSPGDISILQYIERIGGSYCPTYDACAEPFIVDTLNYLVRAERLSVEANDGAPPRYHLTAQGRADAS